MRSEPGPEPGDGAEADKRDESQWPLGCGG